MKKTFEPLQAEIESLHPEGYGIANSTIGRLAIPGSLKGELVKVQPLWRKKKLRFARVITVDRPSPERVDPFCPAAGQCGGCSFQHFNPSGQLAFKEQQLMDLLADNMPDVRMKPIVGKSKHYRVKARLGVKFVTKKNRVLVGFREKLGGYITDIDRCEILAEPVSDYINAFASLVESFSNPTVIPQLEIAVGVKGAAVVVRHLDPLTIEDMEKLGCFGEQHSLDIYLQPGNESTTWKYYPQDDNERLYYHLNEWQLTFGFHPLDFIQVNSDINPKLISRVLDLLEVEASDRVIDYFCGIGNFTLPLSLSCEEVLGLEGSESAVVRAEENVQLNQLSNHLPSNHLPSNHLPSNKAMSNVQFRKVDLFDESAEIGLEDPKYNKVLLDPPRSGALNVVKKLVNSKVKRVVYVSCNPATLARDAKVLCDEGNYRLITAGVVDMFPQTTHVESIACFIR